MKTQSPQKLSGIVKAQKELRTKVTLRKSKSKSSKVLYSEMPVTRVNFKKKHSKKQSDINISEEQE